MNINVVQGNIADQSAAALEVGHFEGAQSPAGAAEMLDQKLGGAIQALIASSDFKGRFATLASRSIACRSINRARRVSCAHRSLPQLDPAVVNFRFPVPVVSSTDAQASTAAARCPGELR